MTSPSPPAPQAAPNSSAPLAAASQARRFQLTAAAITDVGRHRDHNEDTTLLRADLGLYLVADGMGGHNAGDVASRVIAASVENYFEVSRDAARLGTPTGDAREILEAAIRKANHDVLEISTTHPEHAGMGSTLVAIAASADNDRLFIAHVGDSRCYRIRASQIEQITRDHSLVADALAINPQITPEDLARLPRNVITRAMGMQDLLDLDLREESTEPGDIFMLCSDGLSGMLDDAALLELSQRNQPLAETAQDLVDLANAAGGTDNISVVLVAVHALPEEPVQDASFAGSEARHAPAQFDVPESTDVGMGRPKHISCSACGRTIPLQDSFCGFCGNRP